MLWRGENRRVLAYAEPVDMRKGIYGLLGVTQSSLGEDALSGSIFVFINRTRRLLKMLWWDRTGWCVLGKRLERAKYELRSEDLKQELSSPELELLLDGVLTKSFRRHSPKR
jgi:transposase